MSMYRQMENKEDFIERTFKIIEQYKGQESYLEEEYFDVTLYLNCLMGLVVLPREWKINRIQDRTIPDEIKNTLETAVDSNNRDIKDQIKFKEYIIGLRNGIVHFGQNESLKFIEGENNKIKYIELESEINNHNKKLKYKIEVKDSNELYQITNAIKQYICSDID